MVISVDGRVLDINPAGLGLIEADQLSQVRDLPLRQMVHPADRAAIEDSYRRTLSGESSRTEYRITGLRGTDRRLDTVTVPLYAENGTIEAILSVLHDITRQQRDAELRALETRVLDAISAGASLRGILEQIALATAA